jgi:hypothetical protein
VLGNDWGPPERNFRRDYQRVMQYVADPAKPLRTVTCMAPANPEGVPEGLPTPDCTFSTTEEFKQRVRQLLEEWMAAYLSERTVAQTSAAQ